MGVPTQIFFVMNGGYIMTSRRKELLNKLRLSMIVNVTLLVCLMVMVMIYIKDHNTEVREQSRLSNENVELLNKVNSIAAEKDAFYTQVRNDNVLLSDNGAILCYISKVLSEQNKQLFEQNQAQLKELEMFRDRVELYDKYDYAIIGDDDKRTDITYDQLLLLEDLCNNSVVNDPDLFLAWIMTESRGVETAKNSSSSATGYGQFLTSTSKWVFENLCDFEDQKWSSKVALDGDINMEMMVAYVEHLYTSNNNNLYTAIDSYRGAHSDGYIAKINSYLATKGKSLDSISNELKEGITH